MVNRNRVKRKIPLLLIEGSTTDAVILADYRKKAYQLSRLPPTVREPILIQIFEGLDKLELEIEKRLRFT